MHVRVRLMVFALFALIMPSLARGQDATMLQQPAQSTLTAGPTIDNSATAFRALATAPDFSATMQRRQSAGKPVALMIVGGAAILVGAVIGDAPGTLFMVGGAVALLYGLYLYLQ
jgi:hypothetical protein